jgi:hypothetical protein
LARLLSIAISVVTASASHPPLSSSVTVPARPLSGSLFPAPGLPPSCTTLSPLSVCARCLTLSRSAVSWYWNLHRQAGFAASQPVLSYLFSVRDQMLDQLITFVQSDQQAARMKHRPAQSPMPLSTLPLRPLPCRATGSLAPREVYPAAPSARRRGASCHCPADVSESKRWAPAGGLAAAASGESDEVAATDEERWKETHSPPPPPPGAA